MMDLELVFGSVVLINEFFQVSELAFAAIFGHLLAILVNNQSGESIHLERKRQISF